MSCCIWLLLVYAERVSVSVSFFFSSRRRHTRWTGDWSSDVCSSDLGDFNWFNADPTEFRGINDTVLRHVALRGNVETEIAGEGAGAGCGCGYPEWVGDGEVERSNEILERLRETARGFPDLCARLGGLPMHLVAEVGGLRVGIAHGDAESLAGWQFSQEALRERPERAQALL